MGSLFTTCITNFQRPDKLAGCLKSVGIQDPVTVATYAGTHEHSRIVREINPRALHYLTENDYGCNRLWMQAVAMARTQWVSILHDDDMRPASFGKAANAICDRLKARQAGFAVWYGLMYHYIDKTTRGICPVGFAANGIHDSLPLLERLRDPGKLAFSPVAFMYDRETVLDVLSWCEDNLKDCCTRPTMMVGNDLALTIGHVKRFSRAFQSMEPLSLYGHWDGSETIAWTKRKNNLGPMYEVARKRLFDGVVFPARRHKLFVHVVTSAHNLGPRQQLARDTWRTAYKQLEPDYIVVPVTVYSEELHRTSKSEFGDTREMPFLRDLIEEARRLCHPIDIICLTNDDLCVLPDGFKKMAQAVEEHDAAYAHRRDFHNTQITRPLTQAEAMKGSPHGGTDLVMFSAMWWDECGRPNFPDMLIGNEAWDVVFIDLVRATTGEFGFGNVSYHQYHQGIWEKPEVRFSSRANMYNRGQARRWMVGVGDYHGEFDGTNMPFRFCEPPTLKDPQ